MEDGLVVAVVVAVAARFVVGPVFVSAAAGTVGSGLAEMMMVVVMMIMMMMMMMMIPRHRISSRVPSVLLLLSSNSALPYSMVSTAVLICFPEIRPLTTGR